MKSKTIIKIIAAVAAIAVIAALIIVIAGHNKNTGKPDDVTTIAPDATVQPTEGAETPTELSETTPSVDASSDPDATPDATGEVDPTDDQGAHLIEDNGDIVIEIPSGQGTGGL